MSSPHIFVMSTHSVGPREARRPAGILHGAPHTMPPVNQTLCGLRELYWFGEIDFQVVEGDKCPTCVERIAGVPGPAGPTILDHEEGVVHHESGGR